MGWLALYLFSALLFPAICIGWLVNVSNESVTINSADDALHAFFFCLFWPIFLGVNGADKLIEKRKRYHKERYKQIICEYDLERLRSLEDRTMMVNIPESDLKFLLKAHRKNKIKISTGMFAMVREELMNRNAERCLLK